MNNGLIKIITGLRRCGKSYLLFNQFYNYLINFGVKKDHIITFAFDTDEDLDKLDDYFNELPTKKYDRSSRIYLINSKKFRAYIKEKIKDEGKYYILLDEIQLLDDFVGTLNGFLKNSNLDVYVTGSNSHLLSNDIITTFRGRGDQIKLHPLSFEEFYNIPGNNNFDKAFEEYSYFGGMPLVVLMKSKKIKVNTLKIFLKKFILKTLLKEGVLTIKILLADSLIF